MGGLGSGLYGGTGKKSKRSVESCRGLDLRQMQKEEALSRERFGWKWVDQDGNSTGSIGVVPGEEGLLLLYKEDGISKEEMIYFAETSARFGKVKWFLCPSCGNRYANLYFVDSSFACRICHNLNYRSSQSADDLEYFHWQMEKICRRLRGEYDPMAMHPPERPAGMHRKTYKRIFQQYEDLALKRHAAFMRAASAILRR